MIEKPSSCTCVSVETGTLIFAIVNVILVTLACITAISVNFYWAVGTYMYNLRFNGGISFNYWFTFGVTEGIVVMTALIGSFIAFVFAIVLLHGIVKKRSGHIKAYFIYGIVVKYVSLLGTAVFFYITGISIPLLVCFIYWLVLIMIYRTYKKFETAENEAKQTFMESQVAVCLGTLASTVGLAYWAVITYNFYSNTYEGIQFDMYVDSATSGVALIVTTMFAYVAFIFSVILTRGIIKKRHDLIKAYFVFGVVVTILVAMADFAYFYFSGDFPVAFITLLTCFAYGWTLSMIHTAYKKLAEVSDQYKHKLMETQHYLVQGKGKFVNV